LFSDIQALRPTIFGSFPLFYNKLHRIILENINNQPRYVKWMVHKEIENGRREYLAHGKVGQPSLPGQFFLD